MGATAEEQATVETATINAAAAGNAIAADHEATAAGHEAAATGFKKPIAKETARKNSKLQKFQKRQTEKAVDFQDFKIRFFRENLLRIICALILASSSVAHE